MKKELLKKFYLLQEAVRNTEREIFNPKYFEGNGFVWFEHIRGNLTELCEEFEAGGNITVEILESLMQREGYWDTELLTEEHRKKFRVDGVEDAIRMNEEFRETCKYCFIPLKTLDEALDFMQSMGWIK